MAHPMKSESARGHEAKLRKMTEHYGSASGPANNRLAPTNLEKAEGPQDAAGFGAESGGMPGSRADRAPRRNQSNPVATYQRGGAVKARASGGRMRKGKHGSTHVNVIVAPQSGAAPTPPPPPMIPPGAAAAPMPMPPPKPPMGLPPGAAALPMAPGAPGGLPPGIVPPRKSGGRVDAVTEKTLKGEGLTAARAAGGKVAKIGMTAGAASGEGRLEKAEAKKKHPLKPQAV